MTVTVDQIKREAAILNAKCMIAQAAEQIHNQFNILQTGMGKLHDLLPDEHLCAYSVSLSTPEYPPLESAPAAAPVVLS